MAIVPRVTPKFGGESRSRFRAKKVAQVKHITNEAWHEGRLVTSFPSYCPSPLLPISISSIIHQQRWRYWALFSLVSGPGTMTLDLETRPDGATNSSGRLCALTWLDNLCHRRRLRETPSRSNTH